MKHVLRYLGISIVKWVFVSSVSFLVLSWIAPLDLKGYVLALPLWALAFVLSFLFAVWAFHTHLPGKREAVSEAWAGYARGLLCK